MIKKYFDNYKNFPREIWIITIITFINRAGTMVVPFLSKYLKEGLGFTYSQIGWIMLFFGVGSLFGTFISGKLSDKIGAYKIMVFSLFVSGLIFISLQFVDTFETLCVGIFFLTTIADMFRPAMMVTVNSYVTKEQRLKALALVRSAVNLGFIFGPVLGGLIIASLGYSALFYIDGGTCIVAIIIFLVLVKEKEGAHKFKFKHLKEDNFAVVKDKPFLLHWVITLLTGIIFFQVFTTLPIYHKEQFGLTEFHSGLLLSLNGILIILFEMPIVNYVQEKQMKRVLVIMTGLILMAISYFLISLVVEPYILIIAMIFMSFGVMLTFPLASEFVMNRSYKNQEGIFMSVFQMSYGFAHVMSAKTGMEVISRYGFNTNWIFNGCIGLVAAFLALILYFVAKKERENKRRDIAESFFG